MDGSPCSRLSRPDARSVTGYAELVEILRTDRERGARLLFERFAPRVERLLVKLLGPGPDVPERLSDTLMRAIDRIDDVHAPEGLESWLVAIAVRVAHEELRARRRRRWFLFEEPKDYEAALTIATPFEEREACARVYSWIAELSPNDRVLFVLRRLEGFELVEIGEATGRSLATVKRHLARLDDRFTRHCSRDEALCKWVTVSVGASQ